MFMRIIVFICVITLSLQSKVHFVSHPNSFDLKPSDSIDSAILENIYSASLSLPIEKVSQWSGLVIRDPFQTANAIYQLDVDGLYHLKIPNSASYESIELDANNVASSVQRKISERYSTKGTIIDSSTVDENINEKSFYSERTSNALLDKFVTRYVQVVANENKFSGLCTMPVFEFQSVHYNRSVASYDDFNEFRTEISAIQDSLQKIVFIREQNTLPGIYSFKVNNLNLLRSKYGTDSDELKSGVNMLVNAISAIKEAVKNENTVFVVTENEYSDKAMRRDKREVTADPGDLNVAKNYSENYPAIFNIILWISVALLFSLLAISIVIGSMDPGRDSIIYRSTSNKIKKDN